jgi:hypothetical protein
VEYVKDRSSLSARTEALVWKSNMVSAISATSFHIAAPASTTAAADSAIAAVVLAAAGGASLCPTVSRIRTLALVPVEYDTKIQEL